MEWDDIKPKPAAGAMIGESLETLSVAELEARIADLQREIERVKAVDSKRRHEDAASALFKR